jgi:uncharacterized protein (DUF1778 family)
MEKTREEWAKHFDDLKAQGKELDGLVPVKARVAPNPDTIYSTRYSRDEIALIRDAAKKLGITASAFIRSAALAAASGELDLAGGERAVAVAEVRKKARDLAAAVEKL